MQRCSTYKDSSSKVSNTSWKKVHKTYNMENVKMESYGLKRGAGREREARVVHGLEGMGLVEREDLSGVVKVARRRCERLQAAQWFHGKYVQRRKYGSNTWV